MTMTIVESAPTSSAALELIDALSARLTAITGDDGRSNFKPDAGVPRACFLLAMQGAETVGCGALRPLGLPGAEQVGEIKRMYARAPGQGIGSELLAALEARAGAFGYRTLRLETRKINQVAVAFYLRHGYTVCDNYGPYVGNARAVCFEKHLGVSAAVSGAPRIALWLVDLDHLPGGAARYAGIASAAESSTAQRFKFAQDRERYLASRAALRLVLGASCNAAPSSLVFQLGRYGKPALEQAPGLAFNLSHSGALLAVCVGDNTGPLGVDIELTKASDAYAQQLADNHFSDAEKAYVSAGGAGQVARIYQVWTRKEAYVKALGCGLSMPLASFCTLDRSARPGPQGVTVVSLPERQPQGWQVASLDADPRYAMALSWSAGMAAPIIYNEFSSLTKEVGL